MRRHRTPGLAEFDDLVAHAVAGAQDHQVLEVDLLDTDILPLIERIFGRHVSVEAVVEKLLLEDALAAGAAGDQRRVDTVALERLDDVRSDHLGYFQLDLRVVAHEGRNEFVQQVGRDGRDDAQPQFARGFALELRNGLLDVIVRLDRLARLFQHHLARLGGNDGLFRTVQKHHAKLLFKRLNLHAQRRLRHKTVFGRKRETPAVGHGQQIFELDDCHNRRLFEKAKI